MPSSCSLLLSLSPLYLILTSSSVLHPSGGVEAGNGQPINKLFSATPLVPKARLLSFYLALSDCLSRSSIKFLPLSLSISLSLCACKSFAAATAAAMWSESLRGSMHIAQRETKSERARGSGKGCYRMQFAPRLAVLPVARGNRKPFPPSFRPPSTPAPSPSTTPSSSAPSLLLSSAPLVPSSSGLSLHRPPTPPPPPRIWVEGRESAEGRKGRDCLRFGE